MFRNFSSRKKCKKNGARIHLNTMKSKKNYLKKYKRCKNKDLEMQKEIQPGGVDKKFILLHAFNSKDNESFIYFIQYTGNEKTIASFADVISKADYSEMEGHYVKFEIDIENEVSENTADEMIKCNFGSYKFGPYSCMFYKLTGKMVNPFEDIDEYENIDEDEIARRLSSKFFGNKIEKLFEPEPS